MSLVILCVPVYLRHLAQKTLPSEGRFHRRRRRTEECDEGNRLRHDNFIGEGKGKEVIVFNSKASRCIRQ